VQPVFGGVSAFDAAGLVVAGGVEDEFADQVAGVAVQHADVAVIEEDVTLVPRSRLVSPMWCSRLL
jgi:hypothetical protein